MILRDWAKYSVTRTSRNSVRSLCDSWASCSCIPVHYRLAPLLMTFGDLWKSFRRFYVQCLQSAERRTWDILFLYQNRRHTITLFLPGSGVTNDGECPLANATENDDEQFGCRRCAWGCTEYSNTRTVRVVRAKKNSSFSYEVEYLRIF